MNPSFSAAAKAEICKTIPNKYCCALAECFGNEKYAKDPRPFDENCGCPACQHYSRSYIRHLIKAKESLGMRLAVAHNLYFYNSLMEEIRKALDGGYFESFYQKYRIVLGERSQD